MNDIKSCIEESTNKIKGKITPKIAGEIAESCKAKFKKEETPNTKPFLGNIISWNRKIWSKVSWIIMFLGMIFLIGGFGFYPPLHVSLKYIGIGFVILFFVIRIKKVDV